MKRGTAGCKRLNKFNNLIVLCDGPCTYRGGGPSSHVVYDSHDSIVAILKVPGKSTVSH